MSSEPLVFTNGPANDKGIDRAELLLKLRGVESAEVAHPARQDRANPGGDLRQFKVVSTMHSPTAHAEPHLLTSLFTDGWDKCDRSVLRGGCSPLLAGMCSRESRTTAPGSARGDLHPCNTRPWSFADAVVICSPQTSSQAPDAIQALVLRFGNGR